MHSENRKLESLGRVRMRVRRKRAAESAKRRKEPEIDSRADLAIYVIKNKIPRNRAEVENLARECYFRSNQLTAMAATSEDPTFALFSALGLTYDDYGKVGAFLSSEARKMKKPAGKKLF